MEALFAQTWDDFTLIYVDLRQFTSIIYVDLRRFTSIYVNLCQEMAKMMDQICKNSRTNKEIPIHNGAAFGRPHKGGPAAFGGRPTFVDTIMGEGGYFTLFSFN